MAHYVYGVLYTRPHPPLHTLSTHTPLFSHNLNSAVLRALNGEYILPEAGGDLLRDGASVLPTGRNIYALDPYRMPSAAAMAKGSALAAAILDQHRYGAACGYRLHQCCS